MSTAVDLPGVQPRRLTTFTVNIGTPSIVDALERLKVAGCPVTEQNLLEELGTLPVKYTTQDGRVGVQVRNHTNIPVLVYSTKGDGTKRNYLRELQPSAAYGCYASPGHGFIIEAKSGAEGQTTEQIMVSDDKSQQCFVIWGKSAPPELVQHETLLGDAMSHLRTAEKNLFEKEPPNLSTAKNWVEGANSKLKQDTHRIEGKVGVDECARVIKLIQCNQLSAFASRLQELEGEAPQDLEPDFREFWLAPSLGWLRDFRGNEQPCATCEVGETDRHRSYPRDLALAFLKGNGTALQPPSFEKPGETVFDLLSKFEAVYPRVSRNIPEYAVDVADQKFAAEKILSQIHSSLNAIYRNIVNSHLSYMDLEDIWAMGASMLAAGEM